MKCTLTSGIEQDKDEAKTAKEEEKRLAKEEKRKSKDGIMNLIFSKTQTKDPVSATATPEPTAVAATEQADTTPTLDTEDVQPSAVEEDEAQEDNAATKASPITGSPKSGGRVKSWFKTTFAAVPHTNSRRMSKGPKEPGAFVGGAALTGANVNDSGYIPTNGAGAAAVGGTNDSLEQGDRIGRSKNRAGSARSASLGGIGHDEMEEARDDFNEDLAPPAPVVENRAGANSPIRETKFHEEIS